VKFNPHPLGLNLLEWAERNELVRLMSLSTGGCGHHKLKHLLIQGEDWKLAARLRKETTLSVKQIAGRLSLGSWKSANSNLHHWAKHSPNTPHGQPRV
jgi:hypothetical protein